MATSELDLQALVDDWLSAALPAKEWTHAAHVAVCSSLAWHHSLAGTYQTMKEGLYRFNAATGTPNTADRGYHETLTRFWSTLLFFEIHRGHYNSCLAASNAMVSKYGRDSRADRAYYSFDVLPSSRARLVWIPPDVAAEVALEAFRW